MILAKPETHPPISSKDIKAAVKGVVKFASENPRLQNQLFKEEFPLFLQINSFKIPKARGAVKQVFRVPLKNSPLPLDAEVCLIVPDVKGIPNKEHERHVEHYEAALKAKEVIGIKKIMTFHEFRTEYDTFELKNRLVDLYDLFLVDGRISGKVVHKCGSIFYKKRKVPVAVKLHLPKLKSHIQQALKKAYFQISLKSDSNIVQIGYSTMKVKHLVENVQCVVEFIGKKFPGGIDNVRSLNVYAHRGSSIPIYISLKNPNEIKVPKLTNRKPKAYKSYKGELTTQFNAEVTVKPTGHVLVKRKKIKEAKQENDDDNITTADIIKENKKIDKIDKEENGDRVKKAKKRKVSEGVTDEVKAEVKKQKLKKIKKEKSIKILKKNLNKKKTIEKVGSPKTVKSKIKKR